jgi:cytochrome P450
VTPLFVDFQLERTVFELFIAGIETTSTTLRWALLLMALNPEIQKQVRQEIHEQIGKERAPQMSDRQQLRYTEAVIFEVQRFATLVPNAVPHRAMKDTTLFGFDIPENALIMLNIYAVHRDPKLWADPDHFNPEANFTQCNQRGGFEIVNTEYLIPFGVGRRLCLGDSLARQELWIFFVGLMQRFEVEASSSQPLPSPFASLCNGTVRAPYPFQIKFK